MVQLIYYCSMVLCVCVNNLKKTLSKYHSWIIVDQNTITREYYIFIALNTYVKDACHEKKNNYACCEVICIFNMYIN